MISGEIKALDERISKQVSGLNSNSERKMEELDKRLEQLSSELNRNSGRKMEELDKKLEQLSSGWNSNSKQNMVEFDKRLEQFSQTFTEKLEEQTADVKESLKELSAHVDVVSEKAEKVMEFIQTQDAEKLDKLKVELSEKIHSENVKCYRNIQTLVEELEAKIDASKTESQSKKRLKGYFGGLVFLSLVNIAGVIAVVGRMFGYF